MQTLHIEPWLFMLEPFEGESISHFLGRFRRRNHLSSRHLGDLAGIGSVISRWEKFRFQPFPSTKELEALAEVVQVSPERLREMFTPPDDPIKLEPIRVCLLCLQESPYHRLEWQIQSKWQCSRHQATLSSKCPQCNRKYFLPSEWQAGRCCRCSQGANLGVNSGDSIRISQ